MATTSNSKSLGSLMIQAEFRKLGQLLEGEVQVGNLQKYFVSGDFYATCEKVFNMVDTDKSQTIDQNEALNALRLILEDAVSMEAAMTKFGVAYSNKLLQFAASIITDCFIAVDADNSGALDAREFVDLMKLAWIKAAVVTCQALGGRKLVNVGLVELAKTVGYDKAQQLETYFKSPVFRDTCQKVFVMVDVDKSDSIDMKECFVAFNHILDTTSGVTQAVINLVGASIQATTFKAQLSEKLLRANWKHLDADNSGSLNGTQFQNAMKLVCIEALRLSKQATGNTDIVMSRFKEFQALVGHDEAAKLQRQFQSPEYGRLCQEIFVAADADRSGTINPSELVQCFQYVIKRMPGLSRTLTDVGESVMSKSMSLTKKVFTSIYKQLDSDQSGELDQKEFVHALSIIMMEVLTLKFKRSPSQFDVIINDLAIEVLQTIDNVQAIEYLLVQFNTPGFKQLVLQSFLQADSNRSGSVDQTECLEAFTKLLSTNEQILRVLYSMRLDPRSNIVQYGVQLVNKVFQQLDLDRNNTLDQNEYLNGVKMLYLEILLVSKVRVRKRNTDSMDVGLDGKAHISAKKFRHGTQPDMIVCNLLVQLSKVNVELAERLRQYFYTPAFLKQCESSFMAVDVDHSRTIDKNELLQAFGGLVQSVPELAAKFSSFTGQNATETLKKLGVDVVNRVFNNAAADTQQTVSHNMYSTYGYGGNLYGQANKTSLNPKEYIHAVKFMWLTLALSATSAAQ